MSLGDLLFKCATLENDIEVMRAEIRAQGGIVFGTNRFATEDALMSLIMKLHPRGSGRVAFSDASSLFFYDKELNTLTDPHKMLSRLGVSSGIDRNYMMTFGQQYPPKICRDCKVFRGGVCASINSKVAGSQCFGWCTPEDNENSLGVQDQCHEVRG